MRHETRALHAVQAIDVDGEASTFTVDLAAARRSGSVRVDSATGIPVAGAAAYVLPEDSVSDYELEQLVQHVRRGKGRPPKFAAFVPVDAQGDFEFPGLLSEESLQVVVVVPGHQLALSAPFRVRPGESERLPELVARRAGALEFTVALRDGRKISTFGYRVVLEFHGDDAALRSVRTGLPSGDEPRRIEHLSPGEWTVKLIAFFSKDEPHTEARIQIRAGETAAVELQPPAL